MISMESRKVFFFMIVSTNLASHIYWLQAVLFHLPLYLFHTKNLLLFALSAGAVEYTDCTSAEGWDPSPRVSRIWH